MTTLVIPKKLERDLAGVSQNLGLSKEDFIMNAILFYLKTLENKITLKKELEMWEKASNEDLIKFEKKI